MFNIGDLIKHKRKDIVELGLIINCKIYCANRLTKHIFDVEWNDGEICSYTARELATLVTVIS